MSTPDITAQAAARTEIASEAGPVVQSERLMAGVRVPDSSLVAEALE